MSRALAIASLLLLTAGCTHPASRLDLPTFVEAPVLYLRESLSPEARICVARNKWNDATPVCITIGDLRALLRARQDVASGAIW